MSKQKRKKGIYLLKPSAELVDSGSTTMMIYDSILQRWPTSAHRYGTWTKFTCVVHKKNHYSGNHAALVRHYVAPPVFRTRNVTGRPQICVYIKPPVNVSDENNKGRTKTS